MRYICSLRKVMTRRCSMCSRRCAETITKTCAISICCGALWGRLPTTSAPCRRRRPNTRLEAAWKACHVADAWKVQAIFDSPDGRAANDRLDTAMRLFNYVQSEGVAPDINAFIDQVRQLQIEADSLASLAPVDEAVTLTTPAGTAGLSWEHVWIPGRATRHLAESGRP